MVSIRQVWSWWRHQLEIFSAWLALCAGNSPVTGEFHAQRPVTRSIDVFLDPRLYKRLSSQSWGSWFETPSRSLWSHLSYEAYITGIYLLFHKWVKYMCTVISRLAVIVANYHWRKNFISFINNSGMDVVLLWFEHENGKRVLLKYPKRRFRKARAAVDFKGMITYDFDSRWMQLWYWYFK